MDRKGELQVDVNGEVKGKAENWKEKERKRKNNKLSKVAILSEPAVRVSSA